MDDRRDKLIRELENKVTLLESNVYQLQQPSLQFLRRDNEQYSSTFCIF